MQDRYVGDIGDYAKYSFLNALSNGQRLGIAWYLFPDQSHNADGKHIGYLNRPELWRHAAPELFDLLKDVVVDGRRSTKSVEQSGYFPATTKFASERLEFSGASAEQAPWRLDWYSRTEKELAGCDIVFADPDNGFCPDDDFKLGQKAFWKRLPLREAQALASGRTAVFYHHNTRRAGGHDLENEHWLDVLGMDAFAVKVSLGSVRTFFVANPDKNHREAAVTWGEQFNLKAKGKPKVKTFRL